MRASTQAEQQTAAQEPTAVGPGAPPKRTKPMRVVIEVGHEDTRPGAPRDGVREVDLNRAMAEAVAALGNDDISYEIWQRPSTPDGLEILRRDLEKNPPDLVIPIHHNASDSPTAQGTILFYAPEHGQSGRLVSYLQREAERLGGGFASLGESVRSSAGGNSPGDHYRLRHSGKYGAVLVEVGFMSNPDNLERMQTEQFRREAAAQLHGAIWQFGLTAGLLPTEHPPRPASRPPGLAAGVGRSSWRGRMPVHDTPHAPAPGGPGPAEPRVSRIIVPQPSPGRGGRRRGR